MGGREQIEGKSAGELTILKLITAMQLDGRTSDITRLSSEPEFLEGMKSIITSNNKTIISI